MEIWKTKPVSLISTPPATTTDNCPTRRYTNTPLGTKNRSGHLELAIRESLRGLRVVVLQLHRLCLRDVPLNPAHCDTETKEADQAENLLRAGVLRAGQTVAVGDHMLRLDVAEIYQSFAENKLGEVFEFIFELRRVLLGDPRRGLGIKKSFHCIIEQRRQRARRNRRRLTLGSRLESIHQLARFFLRHFTVASVGGQAVKLSIAEPCKLFRAVTADSRVVARPFALASMTAVDSDLRNGARFPLPFDYWRRYCRCCVHNDSPSWVSLNFH